MLHQDNAPGHVAKDTMSFMKEHSVNVKMPHEWLRKSVDATSVGNSIWGVMKE